MEKSLSLTEKKRLDILNAAQEEFKEKGFLGVSMDSLAKRAKVSKRTVYNHFSSKEILFHNIVEQLFKSFCRADQIEYQSNKPLDEQLLLAAKNELTRLASEKYYDLSRIILSEFIRSTDLSASTLEHLGVHKGGINDWIDAAIDDGRIKNVDADYAGRQFLGIIKAVAFWPQLLRNDDFPSTEKQQTIAEDAVFMFLSRYEIKKTSNQVTNNLEA